MENVYDEPARVEKLALTELILIAQTNIDEKSVNIMILHIVNLLQAGIGSWEWSGSNRVHRVAPVHALPNNCLNLSTFFQSLENDYRLVKFFLLRASICAFEKIFRGWVDIFDSGVIL